MACRDFLKAERAAKKVGMPKDSYTVMHCDLSSLNSVRQFVDNFRRSGRPLDVLVCNAAVYLPTAKEPRYTADGFELSVGTNHLGHFLLANLLMEDIQHKENNINRRVIIVGSITGILAAYAHSSLILTSIFCTNVLFRVVDCESPCVMCARTGCWL